MAGPRTAQIQRVTNETKIDVSINLDSYPGNTFGVKQEISVSTGIGFLDHVKVFFFLEDAYAERWVLGFFSYLFCSGLVCRGRRCSMP